MNVLSIAKKEIRDKLYPFTLIHVVSFFIVTGITFYVTGWFLKYKLVRWIYIATIIVMSATLYNDGDDEDVVKNIFKLATI